MRERITILLGMVLELFECVGVLCVVAEPVEEGVAAVVVVLNVLMRKDLRRLRSLGASDLERTNAVSGLVAYTVVMATVLLTSLLLLFASLLPILICMELALLGCLEVGASMLLMPI